MRRTRWVVSPTALLILLLLPAMVVGAAHVVTHPDSDDHCILCLLYHSIAAAVAVALALCLACPSIRQWLALPSAHRPRGSRPTPLGRSPPIL